MFNKSNKHIRKLRFGLGALRKITQNGRSGPTSLKRSTVRLSEPNDESQDVPRLRLAWRSLGSRLSERANITSGQPLRQLA